jgi:hypothetical protein
VLSGQLLRIFEICRIPGMQGRFQKKPHCVIDIEALL